MLLRSAVLLCAPSRVLARQEASGAQTFVSAEERSPEQRRAATLQVVTHPYDGREPLVKVLWSSLAFPDWPSLEPDDPGVTSPSRPPQIGRAKMGARGRAEGSEGTPGRKKRRQKQGSPP